LAQAILLLGISTKENALADIIQISGRSIGLEHSPYIIAELSGNHNGDIYHAMRLSLRSQIAI
jgi:hypothetical protein